MTLCCSGVTICPMSPRIIAATAPGPLGVAK